MAMSDCTGGPATQAHTALGHYLESTHTQQEMVDAYEALDHHLFPPPPPASTGMDVFEMLDKGNLNVAATVIDNALNRIDVVPHKTFGNKALPYFFMVTGIDTTKPFKIRLNQNDLWNTLDGAWRWGVWSADGVNWYGYDGALTWEYGPTRVTLTKLNPPSTLYCALYEPFTAAMMEAWVQSMRSDPAILSAPSANPATGVITTFGPKTGVFGKSCPAMPLYGLVMDDPAFPGPKNRGLFTLGSHPEEDHSVWAAKAFWDLLLHDTDPDAVKVRQTCRILWYPDVNPQGRYLGLARNYPGDPYADTTRDTNRQWANAYTLDQQATAAAIAADTAPELNFLLDAHGYAYVQSGGLKDKHMCDARYPLTGASLKHPEWAACMQAKIEPGITWQWSASPSSPYSLMPTWMYQLRNVAGSMRLCAGWETCARSNWLRPHFEAYGRSTLRALAEFIRQGHLPIS